MVLPFQPQSDTKVASGVARPGTGSAANQRVYRLVDHQGDPHPVLDDLYDTLDSAWSEALSWWH
ncbi:MAG: hypothetical protein ACK512_01265, partial [Cyanobium sp.]